MTEWKQWEGQLLNHAFVLGTLLAGSEHSAVFRTHYVESQPAVLKVIPVDPGAAAAALSRLDSVARLSHPNLIRLFDWGVCHGDDRSLLYIVMEDAAENLSQILPQRALTTNEARDVLLAALDALAGLHKAGLVHGRLKPSNILAANDRVKLSSDLLGPVDDGVYSPPEALHGDISPAGDVWSLALVMVEGLTQRLPDRTDRECILSETVPEPFLDIARHCLEPDPQRRWPVQRVRERLAEAPAVRALKAGPPAPAKVRQQSRSSAAAVLAMASALMLAGVSIRHFVGRPTASSRVEAAESKKGRVTAVRPAPPARQFLADDRPSPLGPRVSPRGTPRPAAATADRMVTTASAAQPDGEIRRVLPDVPAKALSTIQGKVIIGVAVDVDPAGNVIDASLESPGTSPYFAGLALQAARGWKFSPSGAPRVKRILRFEFRQSGTDVQILSAQD